MLDVIVHPNEKRHHLFFSAIVEPWLMRQAIEPMFLRNELIRGMARKLSRACGHRVIPPAAEDLKVRGWMSVKTARSRGPVDAYCEFSESREQDAESW